MENHRPKRRYLVVSEYIQACLDEQTLLDEEGENPALEVYLHIDFVRSMQNSRPDQVVGSGRLGWNEMYYTVRIVLARLYT